MHAMTLPLLLCSWLVTQKTAFPDLAFYPGTLAGWEGKGFAISQTGGQERQGNWVSSQDQGGVGRKAFLNRAFLVPAGAGVIRFSAYAARGQGCTPDDRLDVALMAAGKRIIPKLVRTASGWETATSLLPPKDGHPQEYIWRIEDYAGQYLRLVLVDDDDRPGSHVCCSGFQILAGAEFEVSDFTQFMVRLAEQHHLAPMMRYESPHFIALSNADESLSEILLRNCELLYALFWDHFRHKGFTLREPQAKLMVAMFDSQASFNAYWGRKVSPLITGMYDRFSNRLAVYDCGQNELHLFMKSQAERQAGRINSHLDRQRVVEAVKRWAHDYRTGANISTVMHEVAHQLSFNCGMLNRDGDVPFWLAEGLACYCEATDNGSWQSIAEPNPQRLMTLLKVSTNKGRLIRLTELITRDDWRPSTRDKETALLAYAQSWALFRMLMEEQPQNVRAYLKLIYHRGIRDRRLADFQLAFSHDQLQLQRRYEEYIRRMIYQLGEPRR